MVVEERLMAEGNANGSLCLRCTRIETGRQYLLYSDGSDRQVPSEKRKFGPEPASRTGRVRSTTTDDSIANQIASVTESGDNYGWSCPSITL
jgi:hypothetical protein